MCAIKVFTRNATLAYGLLLFPSFSSLYYLLCFALLSVIFFIFVHHKHMHPQPLLSIPSNFPVKTFPVYVSFFAGHICMHCLCFYCTLTLYPSLIPLIGLCLTTLPFSVFLSLFLSIYFYPSSAVRRITLCLTYTCMFCDANCQFRIFHFCYDHYLDWPSDMVRFFT